MNGNEKSDIAITAAIISMNAQKIAVGGPRRDWKNLSEIKPPANPPTMPNTQRSNPQFARIPSAPGCFTSCPKIVYHCMIVAQHARRQLDEGKHHQERVEENHLEQIDRRVFLVHVTRGRVVCVEIREPGVLRRVLDQPKVQDRPRQ